MTAINRNKGDKQSGLRNTGIVDAASSSASKLIHLAVSVLFSHLTSDVSVLVILVRAV